MRRSTTPRTGISCSNSSRLSSTGTWAVEPWMVPASPEPATQAPRRCPTSARLTWLARLRPQPRRHGGGAGFVAVEGGGDLRAQEQDGAAVVEEGQTGHEAQQGAVHDAPGHGVAQVDAEAPLGQPPEGRGDARAEEGMAEPDVQTGEVLQHHGHYHQAQDRREVGQQFHLLGGYEFPERPADE